MLPEMRLISMVKTTGDGAAPAQISLAEEDPNSISSNKLIADFTIFPNPVQEVLNLKIASRYAGAFDLQILNAQGKRVQAEQINLIEGQNATSISVNDLPAGLYLISLSNDQNVITQSMLKM